MVTFIHEENITVFAHDLDNQVAWMIPTSAFLLNVDFYDTVVFDLFNRLQLRHLVNTSSKP